jgi:hypothetical protein
MMSSFQAGTDRGRRDAQDTPDGEVEGDGARVAPGEQSGTDGNGAGAGSRPGRRRADDGGVDDTTVEAT